MAALDRFLVAALIGAIGAAALRLLLLLSFFEQVLAVVAVLVLAHVVLLEWSPQYRQHGPLASVSYLGWGKTSDTGPIDEAPLSAAASLGPSDPSKRELSHWLQVTATVAGIVTGIAGVVVTIVFH
jgi:hypothetical protein